jgi:hypothetical protein
MKRHVKSTSHLLYIDKWAAMLQRINLSINKQTITKYLDQRINWDPPFVFSAICHL